MKLCQVLTAVGFQLCVLWVSTVIVNTVPKLSKIMFVNEYSIAFVSTDKVHYIMCGMLLRVRQYVDFIVINILLVSKNDDDIYW